MTREEIVRFLDQHRRSFASQDAATLAADHLVDGTFESQAAGRVRGRDGIQGVYAYWLSAFPDLEFTWREPIIEGDRVALFWHFRGTLSGEFFGHARTGTSVEFPGVAEYHLAPGGIISAKHVFDFTGALVTAGVLKVKPS